MLICPKGQIPALCLPRGRVGGRHSQGQRSHADSCPQPRAHFSVSFPPPRANTLVGAGGGDPGTLEIWKPERLGFWGYRGLGGCRAYTPIIPPSEGQTEDREARARPANPARHKGGERGRRRTKRGQGGKERRRKREAALRLATATKERALPCSSAALCEPRGKCPTSRGRGRPVMGRWARSGGGSGDW